MLTDSHAELLLLWYFQSLMLYSDFLFAIKNLHYQGKQFPHVSICVFKWTEKASEIVNKVYVMNFIPFSLYLWQKSFHICSYRVYVIVEAKQNFF